MQESKQAARITERRTGLHSKDPVRFDEDVKRTIEQRLGVPRPLIDNKSLPRTCGKQRRLVGRDTAVSPWVPESGL